MNALEFLVAGSFEIWLKVWPGDLESCRLMRSGRHREYSPSAKRAAGTQARGGGYAHAHCPGVTRAGWQVHPPGSYAFYKLRTDLSMTLSLRQSSPGDRAQRRLWSVSRPCVPSVCPVLVQGAPVQSNDLSSAEGMCVHAAARRSLPALLPSLSFSSICSLGLAHLQVCGGNARPGSCFSGSHAGSVEASDELESHAQNPTAVGAFLIVSR